LDDKLTDDRRQRLVRHGHLPERATGISPVAVCCPRGRDRVAEGPSAFAFRRRFCPATHASRNLSGVSTGDFEPPQTVFIGYSPGFGWAELKVRFCC
jgi:putative transposase